MLQYSISANQFCHWAKSKVIPLLSLKQHLTLPPASAPVVVLLYPLCLVHARTRTRICKSQENGVNVSWSVSFVPPHSPPPQSRHLGHRPSSGGCSAGPPGCSDRPRSYMEETPPCKGLHGSGNHCHYWLLCRWNKLLGAFHLNSDYKLNTFFCIITATFLADTRKDCLTMVFFDFWLRKGMYTV